MGEIVESNRLKTQEKLKFCSLHELNPKVTQFKYLKIKFEGNRLARKATIEILIFHSFVCKFGWVDKCLDAVRGRKIYRQMYGKLKKLVQ